MDEILIVIAKITGIIMLVTLAIAFVCMVIGVIRELFD